MNTIPLTDIFRQHLADSLKSGTQPDNRVIAGPNGGTIVNRPSYQLHFRVEKHRGLGPAIVAHVRGRIPDDDFYPLAQVDLDHLGVIQRALINAGAYDEAEQVRLHGKAILASNGPIYTKAPS